MLRLFLDLSKMTDKKFHIKKVVGVPRSDGQKDYRIVLNTGETYLAKRQGRAYCCLGHVDSLRQIKTMIEAGELPSAASDPSAASVIQDAPCPTWDCVPPEAWLCVLLDKFSTGQAIKDTTYFRMLETLDSRGYLTEAGVLDMERALADIRRIYP